MIKLIHPKTETIREVAESNHNKRQILARAGFIPFDKYKPKKKKVVETPPTIADVVEDNKLDAADRESDPDVVTAIHASGAARGLIKKHDLDASLIEGSGKDGQITKPDVKAHLKAIEESEAELPDQPTPAADIPTHDDPEPPEGNIAQVGEEEDTQPDTSLVGESGLEAVSDAPDAELVDDEGPIAQEGPE